jgi:uncharacterized protein YegP (UPF0339 family)
MPGTFVVEMSKNGKVKFNLRAGNSQVILTSEMYEARDAAANGIESVRKNAADEGRFTIKKAKDGSSYFVLTATNGQTIGKSEMYKSASSMRNGIKSVQANAPGAKVVDRT